jgi:hypothetical protein
VGAALGGREKWASGVGSRRCCGTGEIVKDYGLISEGMYNGAKRRISVVLAERGTRRVFIRVSYRRWLAANVVFVEWDHEAASKLQTALDDAVSLM